MSGFRPRFFINGADLHSAVPGATDGHGADLAGTELPLSPEDSYHASRVLRLKTGDECEVVVEVDSSGGAAAGGDAGGGAAVYAATVSAATDPVRVRLGIRLDGASAGACYRTRVGLVQALGKPAAMEYVLEKGTEVGASFFCFVRTAGSPKKPDVVREDHLARWRRIVREAAKQSKQVAIPRVAVLASVDEAFREMGASDAVNIALDPEAPHDLQEIVTKAAAAGARGRPIALWVGPEGGWTSAESERFSDAAIVAARLGRSVLRTETAGPVAVAVARLALGDW